LMTTMRVVGECFFWYRLTRVFPDKFHRAVKRLCVCVCVLYYCLQCFDTVGWAEYGSRILWWSYLLVGLRVCLSVSMSQELHRNTSKLIKSFVHVSGCSGSVLLWHYILLCLCTSCGGIMEWEEYGWRAILAVRRAYRVTLGIDWCACFLCRALPLANQRPGLLLSNCRPRLTSRMVSSPALFPFLNTHTLPVSWMTSCFPIMGTMVAYYCSALLPYCSVVHG